MITEHMLIGLLRAPLRRPPRCSRLQMRRPMALQWLLWRRMRRWRRRMVKRVEVRTHREDLCPMLAWGVSAARRQLGMASSAGAISLFLVLLRRMYHRLERRTPNLTLVNIGIEPFYSCLLSPPFRNVLFPRLCRASGLLIPLIVVHDRASQSLSSLLLLQGEESTGAIS